MLLKITCDYSCKWRNFVLSQGSSRSAAHLARARETGTSSESREFAGSRQKRITSARLPRHYRARLHYPAWLRGLDSPGGVNISLRWDASAAAELTLRGLPLRMGHTGSRTLRSNNTSSICYAVCGESYFTSVVYNEWNCATVFNALSSCL